MIACALRLLNLYLKTFHPAYSMDDDTVFHVTTLFKCLFRATKIFASYQRRGGINYNKDIPRIIQRQRMAWKLEKEEIVAHVLPRDEKIYDLIVTLKGHDQPIFSSEETMPWGMNLRDIHTVLLGFGFNEERYEDTLMDIYFQRISHMSRGND